MGSKFKAITALVVIVGLLAGSLAAGADAERQRIQWAIIDKMTVLEGGATFNSAVTINDSLTTTGDLSIDDLTVAGTGSGLTVGNGTPTVTMNGEDAYVEGTFEVDGASRFDSTVSATGAVNLTQVNAAGGSANPFDWTGTAGIMNGSDDLTIIDLNLTNANHTTATNTIQAIDISGITADAQATETAIKIGAGWDYGLDLDGNVAVLGADGGLYLDESSDDVLDLTTGAATGKLRILTGNQTIGGGTMTTAQDGGDLYVTDMLEVDGTIYGDGEVWAGMGYGSAGCTLHTDGQLQCNGSGTIDGALTVGGGEGATGCTLSSAGALQCDGAGLINTLTVTSTTTANGAVNLTQVNAAGASANPFDFTGTLGVMDGSDDFTAVDINITNANHTTATNTIQAIDIAGITQDAQATETAIKVGAGWDWGMDLDGTPVIFGADAGIYMDELADGVLITQMGTGTDVAQYLTGNVIVGNGSPTQAQDGEDLYVESTVEVDGSSYLEGAVYVGGGEGSTGCTLSAAGAIQCDSSLLVNAATVTGTALINGDLTVDDTFNVDEIDYTSSGNQNLTPAGSLYELAPVAALTITLQTGSAEVGDILILANTVTTNTVIADTNVRTTTGGALTLGQYDVVAFLFVGGAWYELWLAADS